MKFVSRTTPYPPLHAGARPKITGPVLSSIYFSSGPVRSVVGGRLVLKSCSCTSHESAGLYCTLFQCKLWLLPALFISQSPAHHRVYRDRERGLGKLSGVDVLYMFILRDSIGSFSDWQRYGPARAHSGAPLLDPKNKFGAC